MASLAFFGGLKEWDAAAESYLVKYDDGEQKSIKSDEIQTLLEDEAVAAEHVMLSYEWSSQSVIVRINESLNRRGYVTWLDVEQMKGSIMDA